MREYYRLDHELYFQGRWYLDGPADDAARDDREFSYGKSLELRGPLVATIYRAGQPLDFTLTLSQVPILSQRLANAVRHLVQKDAQLFPVQIDRYEGFEVMNTTTLVACLDENRSDFTKWTQEDGRPDKIGHYQMVTRLRLNPQQIPPNLHVFRVLGWKIALIVSQAFVDAVLPLHPTGVKLELVV